MLHVIKFKLSRNVLNHLENSDILKKRLKSPLFLLHSRDKGHWRDCSIQTCTHTYMSSLSCRCDGCMSQDNSTSQQNAVYTFA